MKTEVISEYTKKILRGPSGITIINDVDKAMFIYEKNEELPPIDKEYGTLFVNGRLWDELERDGNIIIAKTRR